MDSAENDERLGLHALWREAAEKRLGAGIDWHGIVLDLLRHVEDAWDEGYRSGLSNAMRRMSDEPNAPTTPNPYRARIIPSAKPAEGES